ncbi:response regulator transcription factor [Flavobacterium johnsoniae]|jgi:DNA-binding response OmpR family regulator|uniref:Two component transcriptional regulator, winged helix family n=1 Tax=Flavobacterium johnsoniae (strain ATCC 17061 / DSM 2064 / JCM 8514 / BCRC 14874 / CCUG 350202 / NBRC 14942 / NCIMB 11054 / UW101) TaxID=376686 RepID=A5FA01_FLAJ1|nr:response regulator transcription factor [Flavobacterium johnsoniae]ABQ07969.1 two component transcriptional regulator, winged helix family [Flavobacterium johnsoniae UW101]OXG02046.1 DNA-binding response regulator [Flavobacterium johnsoniae UW101]WQG80186.1 response regulator transcription factor [Flavobacterium johnsoniae UW101]SHK96188.1 DNA-binding response regulator, OmpR family, contains REC and winged-helix (wHTH) domain [Flavobacterium johnsoniae]
MKNFKILYTEDDETLAFLTKDNLEQNNYEVIHCTNGKSGLETFKNEDFDICIFDIMMPKMDGFELAEEVRKIDNDVPIIFLSAKTLKEDRIKGLRLGADDYLVKPFSIEELILKIEVFLKRSQKNNKVEKSVYEIGKYQFDTKNFILFNEEEKVGLTQREAELLKLFIDNKNLVLKREQILTALWGTDDYFMGRSLDVFISRLRKILANEKGISIENLHGIGFRFSIE